MKTLVIFVCGSTPFVEDVYCRSSSSGTFRLRYNYRTGAVRGVRFCGRRSLFASVCGSDVSSSMM